jgi:hypothetical protein
MAAIPVSEDAAARVGRLAGALEWRDPATGYRRRRLTGPSFPADVAEVGLPPGARAPYPAAAFAFIRSSGRSTAG